jgi:hypothetical protein
MSRTGRIGPCVRPGILALLVVSAAVVACGKPGQMQAGPAQQQAAAPPPQAAPPQPAAQQPAAQQPVAQQPAPPQPSPPPAATPPLPAGALATSDGEFPGVTAAVNELKRGPNTVTLKVTIVNGAADKDVGFEQFHEYGRDGNAFSGVHLIDAVGKKKYFVQRDGDGNCLCSSGVNNVPHGGQEMVWAKFPAPPDDVQKISVEIPHFVPMEDVPISR